MGLFHRRPLALGALLFMLSGAVALLCDIGPIFLGAVAVMFAIITAATLMKKNKRLVPILLLIFSMICGGFLRSYFYRIQFDRVLKENSEKTAEVEMTINSVQYALSFKSSCEATVTRIDGKSADVDVIFEVGYDSGLKPGTAIRTVAEISDFSHDEDGFREKAYYNSKGIFLKMTEAEGHQFEVLTRDSPINRLEIKTGLLRDEFTTKLSSYMPEENGLPAAVFLGDRSALEESDKLHFRRTGTYHLLALSGMHLSVLAGILDFILKSLAIRRGKRLIISTAAIIFYVALTGFALSVVRAAIMLFVSYVAYFVRREKDSLTSLLIAGALICTVSPCAISDVGFILSFATTFGIVAFYPSVESRIIRARSAGFAGKAAYHVLSSLGISVVALMCALPVSWLYFGKIAIISPLGTLLLSPLIAALMLLTPMTLIFGALPFIGDMLGHLTLWVSKAASHTASLLSRPDNIELSLDYPFTPFFFIPFFASVLVIVFFKLKHLKFYFLGALAVILCFFAFHAIYVKNSTISAQLLCRGENEYFLISKSGQNTLIDMSDGSYGNLYVIAEEAASRGYCQIDALVLTHYHTKHISSISRLLKNQTVRQIVLPQPINETETNILLSIADTSREMGIEVHVFPPDDLTLFGKTKVTLSRDYIKASTHPILALNIDGEVDISYLGSSFASYREVTELCENVIVGTHGPIQKKTYSLPITDNVRLLSFADRKTAELISKNVPMPSDDCLILLNPTMINIK